MHCRPRRKLVLVGAAMLATSGCAAADAKREPNVAGAEPMEGWMVAAPGRAPRPPSTTLRIEPSPASGEQSLAGAGARPARFGGRRVADVRLRDASIQDAMRLLADVGGFGLVVDPEIEGRVSVDLQRVDPFVALVTLADTNGAQVDVRDGVVVVRKRE